MKLSRPNCNLSSGFTLLELLVGLGILAIILAIASTAMGSYTRILASITEERANMHEARLAMEKITDVVIMERNTRNLVLSLNGNTIQGTAGTNPAENLVMGDPSAGPGGAKLYLNNNHELHDAGGNLIAQYIESISFQPVTGSEVIVTAESGTIQIPATAKFIKITVTAKKGENINSCTIDTMIHDRYGPSGE